MSDVDKLTAVAAAEVGYLEKKSASNLDSKTGNAGSGNFTKYWRDLKPSFQGQYWCMAFVIWIFVQTFGETMAKKLLCVKDAWSYYTPTAAGYFKEKKQWYTYPKVGDVVFFRNSERIHHVGYVYRVTASRIYTIEGNTSKASGVIANGGGVAKKDYAIKDSKIAGYGRPAYGSASVEKKGEETVTIKLAVLSNGSQRNEVKLAKILLNYNGAALDPKNNYFGDTTEKVVKEFQKARNLEADGVIGEKTWAALMGV